MDEGHVDGVAEGNEMACRPRGNADTRLSATPPHTKVTLAMGMLNCVRCGSDM
jgi:hypothetical protein